jgi:hypothetical protein
VALESFAVTKAEFRGKLWLKLRYSRSSYVMQEQRRLLSAEPHPFIYCAIA